MWVAQCQAWPIYKWLKLLQCSLLSIPNLRQPSVEIVPKLPASLTSRASGMAHNQAIKSWCLFRHNSLSIKDKQQTRGTMTNMLEKAESSEPFGCLEGWKYTGEKMWSYFDHLFTDEQKISFLFYSFVFYCLLLYFLLFYLILYFLPFLSFLHSSPNNNLPSEKIEGNTFLQN